jgi:hypothetical protein
MIIYFFLFGFFSLLMQVSVWQQNQQTHLERAAFVIIEKQE